MHIATKVVLALGTLLICLWCYVAAGYFSYWRGNHSPQLTVVFCDVGQGDATLVILGNWQMLVDTGKDGQVLACLSQAMPRFDSKIEVLVLTHPDNDHMGAAGAVINQYVVSEILLIPYGKKTADFMGLYQLLLESKCSRFSQLWTPYCFPRALRFPSRGEGWWVGRQLNISVQHPDLTGVISPQKQRILLPTTETTLQDAFLSTEEEGIDANDLSIVLFLEYGSHTFLLTGDIGKETEQALIEQSVLKDTTVLKVAHHGSKSSTSDEFLSVVRPEIAIISAGKNNSYGHPAPETVTRLRSKSIMILETPTLGSITAVTDGTTLRFFSKSGEVRNMNEEQETE
jgi:competence protein ComEC